ncbi:hypothetical protein NP233_g8577 [Leucocoprinus birnbaumii]|uniref:Uncharacterized protein n=1 Tax=Leucocoprinus birnbaumii TaxID=56174 RepID=A0AAD5YTL8_9AGAR|nr:hypothetical protein NP233_g8577 [Leucocoprinus birnbaumii]
MAEQPSDSRPPWNPHTESSGPPEQGGIREDAVSVRNTTSNWSLAPIVGMNFIAFLLLMLTTFSLPLIPGLYFLWTSQAGGVRFGIWGWCMDEGSVCSDRLGLGYTWEPEVSIPITKALALYPVAAIASLMTLFAFIPILRLKTLRNLRVLQVLAWSTFAVAGIVFVFMIAMWSVADERFKAAGWKVHWGPLPWMSFIATMLLLISAINTLKITSEPRSSATSSEHPFSTEGWPTGAGSTDQRLDRADPEKAYRPTSSSLLQNVFPSPTSDEHSPSYEAPDAKQEPDYHKGPDNSDTSRSSNEIDGKPSHRYRFDSLPYAKARYLAGRSSPAATAKANDNNVIDKALTATATPATIPDVVQVALPPRALRHDSLQGREHFWISNFKLEAVNILFSSVCGYFDVPFLLESLDGGAGWEWEPSQLSTLDSVPKELHVSDKVDTHDVHLFKAADQTREQAKPTGFVSEFFKDYFDIL